jgi:TolB-like protein/DNA-binding winged helix-turn-helix (wHTH) protein/Flp pilus assembly protein TadD
MVRQARHIYEFGPFRLIPEERQLLRDDQPVPLTDKPFDLLLALVENSGRLIKKGELMEMVWPDASVEEANLSVNMTAVRRALGEGPNDHQYIETVPRRGYRFVAGVKERRDEGAEPVGREPGGEGAVARPDADGERQTPAPSPSAALRPRASFRRWPVVLVGILLLSALLLGLSVGGLRGRLPGGGEPVRVQSLAVLPLENLSGDASQDYFADGMTEALITDLAKLGELRVMSRSSVARYKGARPSLPEVGRALNVDAVLTGSVVRSEERIRVAVQLVHAATDRNLWADSYERDLRDVLALQREVARDVASGVRIKLTPQAQARIGGARPVNPEAYDQYLRGKYYLYRQSRENNEAAIVSLERAVAADPTFAAAQAELAQAYVWKLFLFTPKDERLAERAYVAAEKALASDPDSAVAYLARGRLLWTPANHFPHEKAIREYRRALALDPTLDEARNQLALVYCHIGAFDEALRESREAVATNPNNNLAQLRIGQTLNFQGRYEEALSVLRAMPQEANPALVGHQLAWALFNLGREEEAAATLEQLLRDYPEDSGGLYTSMQAVLAASAGRGRTAEEKIKSAVEKGEGYGHFHHTAYHIACAYARMSKPEQAIKWLEVAARDGFPCYPLFEKDTNLDSLRQDARFAALLVKLRQQWESFKIILETT